MSSASCTQTVGYEVQIPARDNLSPQILRFTVFQTVKSRIDFVARETNEYQQILVKSDKNCNLKFRVNDSVLYILTSVWVLCTSKAGYIHLHPPVCLAGCLL